MTMFKLGWSVLTLLIFLSVKSQEIDWNQINSNNILNIIAAHNVDPIILSYSNIVQIGDFNDAELSINAKTDISVKQIGDYNTLYFINSFTDTENKTAITTQGNNNIIDITGSNSISEGMKIDVKGDNKTIFVRNY
jgi:predicted ABC-type exoprotein transport system permease subunit